MYGNCIQCGRRVFVGSEQKAELEPLCVQCQRDELQERCEWCGQIYSRGFDGAPLHGTLCGRCDREQQAQICASESEGEAYWDNH